MAIFFDLPKFQVYGVCILRQSMCCYSNCDKMEDQKEAVSVLSNAADSYKDTLTVKPYLTR